MPQIKDGQVVYTDAEIADAAQANASSEALRVAQAKADTASANALAMQKLADRAAQVAVAEAEVLRAVVASTVPDA